MGFTLVALPLVLGLLYSANQVNQLSKQGASAIFSVAELINTNQKINNTLKKMERYASQYFVLQEIELIDKYFVEQRALLESTEELSQYNDTQIKQLTAQFSEAIHQVHQDIVKPETALPTTDNQVTSTSLEGLQKEFKQLINISEQLNTRSNELINQQAQAIKNSTAQVSHTLLKSLFIIPISLFIAGFFIILITKPLKQLTLKIQQLQQGNFQQDYDLKEEPSLGFIEIKEINDALNRMIGRLHALELQKSSFIRHISHELKTPLAAIREGTELMYDNSVGSLNSDQQEVTKIIRNSTTRLQRLIEELLNFNIVLDSTSLQDKETINFPEIVEQVLSERTLDIKRKGLTIAKKFPNVTIESNAKQLNVIIDNLLSNAIKYSPEYGVITLTGEVGENQLVFSVTDEGTGIKMDQQDKVFDAFYQGTPAKDYNIKSSGLGLTIVKELLMRLNGNITLASRTKKPSGTTMKICLKSMVNGEQK
ncbi:HAMP domain-containing histidine kinase [Colwellia sp. MSW7]|uniref:histidine kinase n=1 Tax=Colwellia maritima TaxID=2912588 RepID=A0ABS9X827_9GAMM|nr:HAMP domain-containing sensor histidine kinase [Colwellia maritima]MCI2285212.1 HAMP domain-containing histidine kinase [Colwellia maritima]